MPTASELIHSAMRLIGAIASGETLETYELNDGLVSLNQMLALWSDERLSVYAIRKESFPLSAASSYTMGPGGSFATARPTQIVAVRVSGSNFTGRGLRLVDAARWVSLMERGGAINLPMKAHVVYGFPLATVYLWPVPIAGVQVELYVTHEFTTFPEALGPDAPAAPMHNFLPQQATYSLAAMSGSFTVGPGGQLATTRPARCNSIAVTAGGFRRSVDLVSAGEWATLIEPLDGRINIPLECYVEYNYPAATINLWPVPGTGTSIEIHSLQQFTAFAALADTVSLPPGYEEAIRFNLAVKLAPEYGRPLDAVVAANAQQSKAALAALNAANQTLGPPPVAAGDQTPVAVPEAL